MLSTNQMTDFFQPSYKKFKRYIKTSEPASHKSKSEKILSLSERVTIFMVTHTQTKSQVNTEF